jgi:hypothetical protein
MVVLRDDDAVVVICELRMAFNLELIVQGVDRATASDEIWLAAQLSSRGKGRESDPRYRNLCRRLGFGLLGVSNSGRAGRLENPAPQCLWLVRAVGPRRLCLDRTGAECIGVVAPGLARPSSMQRPPRATHCRHKKRREQATTARSSKVRCGAFAAAGKCVVMQQLLRA